MTENTIRSQAQKEAANKPEARNSVISKISKWLTGQKEEVETKGPDPVMVAAEANKRPVGSRPRKKPGGRRKPTGRRPSSRPRKPAASGGSESGQQREPGRHESQPQKVAVKPSVVSDEKITRKLLINTDEPEECRIALIENGRVEEFYVDTILHAQTKGNIYKGKVVSVEPNLQAAFVDIGEGKNGFLPFSDIHPEYFHGNVEPHTHWKNLDIEKVIRRGDEVLLQVVKEATGNKGANMTTYISLPGRYLVLMPGSDSEGISRKIEGEARRAKLRSLVNSLTLPEGIGYIVRTASEDITKTAISQDLKYLLNLWKEIKDKGQQQKTPGLIYKEQDIISRFLRDQYTPDIQEILVDNEEAFKKVKKFLRLIPARQKKTIVRLHGGTQPIFNHYQVERQIEQIYQPTVSLPSGGSIVISPTEALVAIDVNSGRTSKDKNFEETIFLANKEAAEELARQLRLRDLGGLIVVDFIDMRDPRHNREVEKIVKASMKMDRAKVDISRISKFGLMQISRQKLASPIQRGSYNVCKHCQGRGLVQSVETLALAYLRRIQTAVTRKNVRQVDCSLTPEVAQYLQNKKRADILELENRYDVTINIQADPTISPTDGRLDFVRDQPATM